jgi:glycosyltransferase involved in cell wall biosynthesis
MSASPPRRGLRILLSSHAAALLGGERVLLALATYLVARGDHVTLEIPYGGPLVDAARAVPGLAVWVSGRNRLPRSSREAVAWTLGAPRSLWRLWRWMRQHRPDVVWVNTIFNPLAAVAARLAGRRTVWQAHEDLLPGLPGAVLGALMRWCASTPVTVSRYMAARFAVRGRGVPGMTILPNVEFRHWAPAPPAAVGSTFTVAYVGQFEPRKRVDDVVRAIAQVPGMRALLIGDGKTRGETERLIAALHVEERVTLAGFVPEPQWLLADTHALVFPAQDEPFGLVALEALALGRPVVAARSGALPEVLGSAALYYDVGDIEQLSRHLHRLATDPALVATLVAAGHAQRERFSVTRWRQAVDGILASMTAP